MERYWIHLERNGYNIIDDNTSKVIYVIPYGAMTEAHMIKNCLNCGYELPQYYLYKQC